ncbi:MAG: TonB-dependent receptor, partial [Planctomycetes bacterium]|nr:TonB-dependent receptor [Planctomycetota bacterium]
VGVGAQEARERFSRRGNRLTGAWRPVDELSLTVLVETEVERRRPEEAFHAPPLGPASARTTWTYGLEANAELLGGDLAFTPSYRRRDLRSRVATTGLSAAASAGADRARERRDIFAAGGAWVIARDRLGHENALRLRANIGRYFREPAFSELFGDRGTSIGNAALKPESGLSRDAGLTLDGHPPAGAALTAYRASAVYFDNEIDNLIAYVQNAQRVSRAENVFRARVRGWENDAALTFLDAVTLRAAYTFQDPADRSRVPGTRDRQLPGRPERQIDLSAEARRELLEGRLTGALFWEHEIAAGTFRDASNFIRLPDRRLHNAGVTLRAFNERLAVTAEARNLTDEHFADFEGFPLPGRAFFLTASCAF